MTGRLIAIAVALLVHLAAASLDGQTTQQPLTKPASQTRQQLTKALQDYREKQDLHGEALTLFQLGISDAGVGNIDGAQSNLAEAAKKMRAQNDLIGVWLALVTMSQLEVATGNSPEAVANLERALAVLNEAKAPSVPFNLETFTAIGAGAGVSIQVPPGLNDAVMAALKPMMIQFSLEPVTHDLYGSVLTQVGQLEKAEAELKAAVAGSVYAQGMYDSSIEMHFGDIRIRQQRYDEARTHYMKALNASSKTAQLATGGQLIKAGIYDRLARLEATTGHPVEAKRWSEKARDLSKGRSEASSRE
jgi:tetratricopeptide (TPR) repeat protein